MTCARALPAYVVVTPVRDEARFIGDTLVSMVEQTHRPLLWVIVDDGSTDRTPEILREHAKNVPWITVVSTGSTQRRLGSAEVLAFQRGFAEIDPDVRYDFIVKLDGDLRLPPTYFERLIARMATHPRWGIASGVYSEQTIGTQASQPWLPVHMPAYHAAGASKVVRRQCFEQIGGFVAKKGWDTVDEIRAGMRGWQTGHFDDIRFLHLKPEGVAMGTLRTHRFHGEIYYQTGGGLLFLLVKAAHRMVRSKPLLLGGLAMLWGYLAPLLSRQQRLVNDDEARFYRALLNRRLTRPVAKLLAYIRP
jgi:biofilm PGA synthesis N-glycosyltransferase PgaC